MTLRSFLRAQVFVATAFMLLATAQPAQAATLYDDFERYAAPSNWNERASYGPWRVEYDGYGIVGVRRVESDLLALRPATARSSDETHAAMVTSHAAFGDQIVRLRMRTARQLRQGSSPRPWEAAWVLWDVLDQSRFYYLVLKPNGWEIGKADPSAGVEGQRYLLSGITPVFPAGRWNDVSIKQEGARIDVWVNGAYLGGVTDDSPYAAGKVGLYTEDAEAHFDNVRSWSI